MGKSPVQALATTPAVPKLSVDDRPEGNAMPYSPRKTLSDSPVNQHEQRLRSAMKSPVQALVTTPAVPKLSVDDRPEGNATPYSQRLKITNTPYERDQYLEEKRLANRVRLMAQWSNRKSNAGFFFNVP